MKTTRIGRDKNRTRSFHMRKQSRIDNNIRSRTREKKRKRIIQCFPDIKEMSHKREYTKNEDVDNATHNPLHPTNQCESESKNVNISNGNGKLSRRATNEGEVEVDDDDDDDVDDDTTANASHLRHGSRETSKQAIPTPEELALSVTMAFHSNVMNTVGRAIAQYVTSAADRYLSSENPAQVEDQPWRSAIEMALKDLASYLSTLQTCQTDDGQTDSCGLLAAFHLDRERALRAAMQSVASLYPSDSPARSAIARYSTAKKLNLAPDLDLLLEQEMIRCSSPSLPNSECLRDLVGFRRDAALVFCGPVLHGLQGLKSFPVDVITFALTEAVSFMEATEEFYWTHDDFPGDDFRSLLMGVNVRALAAIELDPALEPLKPKYMDLKRLAMLQKRPTEPAGFLPEKYSRPFMASDVLLTSGMVYDDLVVKASELLGVLTHLAAIRNLERRGVLCPGFFSAVSIILSHCIAHKVDLGQIGSISIGGIQAAVRRAVAAGRQQQQQQQELADDSDDDEKEIRQYDNTGGGTARLMATVGGFFGDTSAFGEELRQLVLDGHVGDLINFADSVMDKDQASPRIRRLVGSLLDLVGRMKENEVLLKTSVNQEEVSIREKQDDVDLFQVVKSLPDPLMDRKSLANVYVSCFPDFASRHVISVLGPGGFIARSTGAASRTSLTGLLSEVLSPNGSIVNYLKEITHGVVDNLVGLMTAAMGQSGDGSHSLPMENNSGTVSTYIAKFSPFGRDGVFSKNVVAITNVIHKSPKSPLGQQHAMSTELIAPSLSSEMVSISEHMKRHTAVQYVTGTPEGAAGLKKLADNTRVLKTPDSNDQYPALVTVLFGNQPSSSSASNTDSNLDPITSCSTGLLAVAETCTMLTPMSLSTRNMEGVDNEMIISIDIDALEKAIEIIVHRFQMQMAIRIGTCESLKPAKMIAANRADVPVGSLSSKSTAVSEAIVSAFSRRYLSNLHERGCIPLNYKHQDRMADDTLIAAMAKRGQDFVYDQVTLATVIAIAFAVQILFIKNHHPTVEVASKFSSTQTLGLVSSLAFLCVMTALKAAMGMTRLSNPHFFSILQSLNLGHLSANVTGIGQKNVNVMEKSFDSPPKGYITNHSGRFTIQPKMWSIVDSSPMRNVILGSGAGPSSDATAPPHSINIKSMLDIITSG